MTKPTFADAIRAEHERESGDPLFAALKARARDCYAADGETEVDEITVTSGDRELILKEGGAYVLAWVWADIPTDETDAPEEYEAAAERLIAKHQAELAKEAAFAPCEAANG